MGIQIILGRCRFLTFISLLGMFAIPASARVFEVNNTNDSLSVSSLRGAIVRANELGGNNVIYLGAAPHWQHNTTAQRRTFHLTMAGADEDASLTGDLDIRRGRLAIVGTISNVVIDATGLGDRVFEIFGNATLVMQNVTVTGGTSPAGKNSDTYKDDAGDGENGGAVYNAGSLLLSRCSFDRNSCGGGGRGWAAFPDASANGNGGSGGGIYNAGFMLMNSCVVSGNAAGPSGDGGVSGENHGCGGDGGGIYNAGVAAFSDCIIASNRCGMAAGPEHLASGSGGNGGGVYNAGRLRISRSTVFDNLGGAGGKGGALGGTFLPLGIRGGRGGNGGGIYNSGKLFLTLATISGNTSGSGGVGGPGEFGGAGGSGGGVYNSGVVQIKSCTIAGNAGGVGGTGGSAIISGRNGGKGGSGGGILNTANGRSCSVKNTLVALNAAGAGGAGSPGNPSSYPPGTDGASGTNGLGPDVAGDFTSQGYNLVSINDDSTGFVGGLKADQIGNSASPINPLIGELQMNGGLTPTHALLPGSPAIDQGKSFGLSRDQRGHKRRSDDSSIPNASRGHGTDIGAFELGAP